MGALKDNISKESVRELGEVLAGVLPGFDARSFERRAAKALVSLELKARIAHVSAALSESLDLPFALGAPRVAEAVDLSGLSVWAAWPAVEWIALDGLDEPDVALDALGEMTATASAEFAIRPFIERLPVVTWGRLREWARSADEHRRRLASEGTRPRLPWGVKVTALIEDPSPGIELLDLLREDRSEYVRRSVANHLNDVARDHPDLAISTAERWNREGGEHVDAVVRRGLRGLVKRGESRALSLIGADVAAPVEAQLELGAKRATIGETVPFIARLKLTGCVKSKAVVDYAVVYARPSGRTSRKVFKLATLDLEPQRTVELERKLKLADVSIRTHHPGKHAIELLVNGRPAAKGSFELVAAKLTS